MHPRIVVTAAEFTRQFGQLRHEPAEAPVFITHHGRETHVLLTKRRYAELNEPAPRGGLLHDTAMRRLIEWLPHAVLILDTRCTVQFANAAAMSMMRITEAELIGRRLQEAVPAVSGSLIESYLRRAARSGEASTADLPALLTPNAWIQTEIRPYDDHMTLLFRDITDEVRRHRLADRNRALAEAIARHGAVGQLVLNVRGYIESVDAATCDLLALPEERLRNVPLADLVPAAGRVAFRESLDGVLRGGGPAEIELTLVSNRGEALALSGTLVELRGLYGSEGAVLVITRR